MTSLSKVTTNCELSGIEFCSIFAEAIAPVLNLRSNSLVQTSVHSLEEFERLIGIVVTDFQVVYHLQETHLKALLRGSIDNGVKYV